MADKRQLKILDQGVAVWNQWRKEYPDMRPDLSEAHLSDADLSGADLSKADLSGADLSGADLSKADFSGADLSGADLSGTDLSKADLSGTDLSKADLSKAHLSDANLHGADLSRVNLRGADLSNADLIKAHLSDANLREADLSRVNLRGADLSGTDLRGTALRGADLSGADLSEANLSRANLVDADLSGTDFSDADLSNADLSEANLSKADLSKANLSWTNLSGANLSETALSDAALHEANLIKADLSKADLGGADLSGADLSGANLEGSFLLETIFANTNLKDAEGLEKCQQFGPSTIDHRTLQKSGPLPLAFLQRCGLTDDLIDMFSKIKKPQYYSCFISHSSKDNNFVNKLYEDLRSKDVLCWHAPHDMKAGEKVHEQIDEAIRTYDRLLLVLSPNSINSDWVKTEIGKAYKRENIESKRILFPISLVDFEALKKWEYFNSDFGTDLAEKVREYFIPDFQNWKDQTSYQESFKKLLGDLKSTGKKPKSTK